VLLLAVGQEALVALSGHDKAGSGIVFVAVGVAFAIYPLVSVSGYGLLLHKRSLLTFWLTLAAVALNIVLNLVLVPRLGIMGAVWAAVASYACVALLNFAFCPRELRRLPRLRSLAIALLAGALALAAIDFAKPGIAHRRLVRRALRRAGLGAGRVAARGAARLAQARLGRTYAAATWRRSRAPAERALAPARGPVRWRGHTSRPRTA
jgi:hypothetical protein